MKNILSILFLFLLTIPGIANGTLQTLSPAQLMNPGTFIRPLSGMDITISILTYWGASIGGSSLTAGDEIAAFDGTICVGVLRITAPFSRGSVAASQSDGTDLGYTVGHPITLKFWDNANSQRVLPPLIFTMGTTSLTVQPMTQAWVLFRSGCQHK